MDFSTLRRPVVFIGASRTSPDTLSIRVRGELDIATQAHLNSALARLDLDGVRTVELHLRHLTFCDVTAMRHLSGFARDLQRSGRRVSTHDAPRPFLRLADLMDTTRWFAFSEQPGSHVGAEAVESA